MSIPRNVQFTNVRINSDQDLFQIDTQLPYNPNSDEILCELQCIPEFTNNDLNKPCTNTLAALQVNGSAKICKAINIGTTNTEIKGTIRFNQHKFEGFNGKKWVNFGVTEITDSEIPFQICQNICNNNNHLAIYPSNDITSDDSISIGPQPMGDGFLTSQKPTPNEILGGDCRGKKSVDWQMSRNNSNQVASSDYSVIAGGSSNRTVGKYSVISGGLENYTGSKGDSIGGGVNNSIYNNYSRIGGGKNNIIKSNSEYGLIGGGHNNSIINNKKAIICGGYSNKIGNYIYNCKYNSIVGGKYNEICISNIIEPVNYCFIGGGISNKINNYINNSGSYNSIVGGKKNILGMDNDNVATLSFIGGGEFNKLSGNSNSIICGCSNLIYKNIVNSHISNGYQNKIKYGNFSFIGNGKANETFSSYAFIGTGINLTNAGKFTTILNGKNNLNYGNGGYISIINGYNNKTEFYNKYSTILNGKNNQLTSNTYHSAILGGYNNKLGGNYSFIGCGKSLNIGGNNCNILNGINIEISGDYSFIGTGKTLTLNGDYSSILNGFYNEIASDYSFIGSGKSLTINSDNSCILNGTNGTINSGGKNSCIINANYTTITHENCIIIGEGNSTANNQFICKNIYDTSSGIAANVYVTSSGVVGRSTSSKRYKENIENIKNDTLAKIYELRPTTFNFKKDIEKKITYGLIAEEVNEILPEIVLKNKYGECETVMYNLLIPLLLAKSQQLETKINILEKNNKNLISENIQLKNTIQKMEIQIQSILEKINT